MQDTLHFYKKVLISRNWQVYSKQGKKQKTKNPPFTFEECFFHSGNGLTGKRTLQTEHWAEKSGICSA